MANNRLQSYKGFIQAFGVVYGMKVILMRWVSHFTKEKLPYHIRLQWGGVQLRINSSDAELARDLIGKNGGDYDFLQNISSIQNFQTIVDAGANIGLFSMIARREAPNARIIAVEPDHGNCEVCRVNMGFRAGDTLIEAGLWNKNCRLGIKSRATGDVGFTVYEDEKGAINTVCMKQMILDNRLTSIDICPNFYCRTPR